MVVLLYSISVIPLSLVTHVGQPHDAVRCIRDVCQVRLNSIKYFNDKIVDRILVISISFLGHSVGNYHTASHGFVAHESGETGERAGFHFEIGYT